MSKLTLKSQGSSSANKKRNPHIMIIGRPEWQSLISDFIDLTFEVGSPIIETPTYADAESCLRGIEPNVVIVANYKMGLGLNLEKVLAKVPATSVVVMCDKYTLANVIPTGVHFTTSKDIKKLLPVVKSILQGQGY